MVAAVLHFDKGAGVRGESGRKVRGGFADTEDSADDHRIGGCPRLRRQFLGVAEHAVDLGHRSEARRVDLRGASRHHQLRQRPLGPRAADRLACLGNRAVGDGAAVDDDQIPPANKRTDRFAFGDVEATAEGDDLRIGHCVAI